MNTRTRRLLGIASLAAGITAVTLASTGSPASADKRTVAQATLTDATGQKIGTVVFSGPGTYADRVKVKIAAAAAPGLGAFHGFHVHTTGVCNPAASGATNVPFGSAGGHWNPTGANHAAHAGDLPSVLITGEGETYATFETDRFDVASLLDADGSAVVLHAGPDNFANIPATYGAANAATLGTGDAGGRYACGVVVGRDS